MTLLIADHHALFREALRALVEREADFEVVGEATSAADVLRRVQELDPDLLVLDLAGTAEGPPKLIEHLRRRHPALRVLVVTAHPEDHFAVLCLRAGAVGYLTKDRAADELLNAVRKVGSGRRYVSPSLAERLATRVAHGAPEVPIHEALSEREHQVVARIGQGWTVPEIAAELGLSVKTVRTYRMRALAKLGLRNTAEVILYAIRHGLI